MPPVFICVLVGRTMSGPARKTAGFIRKGITCLVSEWPEGMIRYIDAIAIATHLRARSAILQVIFPVIFIHPGPFDKRIQKIIVVVFPEAFPAVNVIVKPDHLFVIADGL